MVFLLLLLVILPLDLLSNLFFFNHALNSLIFFSIFDYFGDVANPAFSKVLLLLSCFELVLVELLVVEF